MRKDVLRQATRDAIRRGVIKVPDYCAECGAKTKLDCHHQEYDDPIDVVFLCATCHDKRHGQRARKMVMVSVPQATCNFCGHVWFPRVVLPTACPRCKRLGWNEVSDKPKKKGAKK
jgi:hypothetical protein